MTNVIHMSINNDSLELLDTLKGSMSRSAFIAKLVKEEAGRQGKQVRQQPTSQEQLDARLVQLVGKNVTAIKKDIEHWSRDKEPSIKKIAEHLGTTYWTARTVQPIIVKLWHEWIEYYEYTHSLRGMMDDEDRKKLNWRKPKSNVKAILKPRAKFKR